MISKFELFQAMRNHIDQMDNLDELAESLDVDREEMTELFVMMVRCRNPEHNSRTKQGAYFGGLHDGFMLGIKAQLAEMFVQCENCGTAMPRHSDDPVPKDYDPTMHRMLCAPCIPSANAHLN